MMNSKLRILHLEDEPADAGLIARELKVGKVNAEILVVATKGKFMSALKDFAPDVILCDNSIPSFDAHQAFKTVREMDIRIPFILVTATMTEEYAVKIMREGADDYVIKDRMERLPEAILSALEKWQLKRVQHESERQLRRSEAFNRGVLNALSSHIAVVDGTGVIVDVNDAWNNFSKENGETALQRTGVGSNYFEVCEKSANTDDGTALGALQGMKDVMAGRETNFYLEYPCHAPDVKRWFGMRVSRFESDTPMVVVAHQNITERVQAERRVHHIKGLLKEAQQLAKIGNWNFDAETSDYYWSEGMIAMSGLPPEYVADVNSSLEILHPDDRERVIAEMTEARISGEKRVSIYRIIRADTKIVRIIQATSDMETNADGSLKRLFGIVEDVTDLHRAQQERDALLESLEQRVADRTSDLGQKNKDILDSITYAKRIQLGLLSPESELAQVFPDSFIMSYPRDIVSGDFFWVHERHSRKFIVVADCTGHGVPGALMSIIGNNLLNEIIINEHYENPSEILQQLDLRLKSAVKGDLGEVKDGMDVVLCMIDHGFYELHFAGAYRPLFISDAKGNINELTPDRQGIGGSQHEELKHFATKRSAIIPKQRIYLTSDGYYSQFGGPDDKKYMKSRFVRTLQSMQGSPMAEQKALLLAAFEDWQGDAEQVDDVLVVGIEL